MIGKGENLKQMISTETEKGEKKDNRTRNRRKADL